MPIELLIFLAALLLVLFRMGIGWKRGATWELRHVIAYLFATLVALRYWQFVTQTLAGYFSFDPQYLAAAAYVLLFLIALLPVGFVVNLRGEAYESVFFNPVDRTLGVLAGICSGGLLAASLLLVLTLALPGKVENFDASKLPVRLDRAPFTVFRLTEFHLAGVPKDSASRTPLPELQAGREPGQQTILWH